MNTPRVGLRLSAAIFAIFALGHLWRLLRHVDVRVGSLDVPIWASGVALIVAGALSIWLWKLSKA